MLIASIGIALVAGVFLAGPGLVDSNGRLLTMYNSTGSDDNLMIELAIPLFVITAATILAMWNRASIRIAVAVFSAAWLVQLWLLHWIEVASLDTTLHQPHGWELGLFLAVWGISLPAVWGFALRHHSKNRHPD